VTVAYRPPGNTPAMISPSPGTALAIGTPTLSSNSRSMSITLYRKNGAPAGSIPRARSHPNTSGYLVAIRPTVDMVTVPGSPT